MADFALAADRLLVALRARAAEYDELGLQPLEQLIVALPQPGGFEGFAR